MEEKVKQFLRSKGYHKRIYTLLLNQLTKDIAEFIAPLKRGRTAKELLEKQCDKTSGELDKMNAKFTPQQMIEFAEGYHKQLKSV